MSQPEQPLSRSMRTRRLMCGASVVIVAALTATNALAAAAAASAPATELAEVVVTGTSIRGQAPVGSSVVSIGQESIEKTAAQTVQQVLKSVPSVVGLGAAGQGGFGSADNAGTDAPTIHGLGASASNSTLILIDGHRLPLSGINHALADPNILPPAALERVEVLADGASSVYGSDAVAGVVNFIVRRHYDGVEMNAQASYGDKYHAYSGGIVAGKTWDGGSVLAAYGYSRQSALSASARSFAAADKRGFGGTNGGSFACAPATIQVGSGRIFTAPYTGAGVTSAAVNAPCDYSGVADLLPAQERNSALVKVTQDLTDRLTVTADGVYSKRNNVTRIPRGSVTATIFGPGAASAAQINPFFTGLPGNAATAETIRFDANSLLGPGAHINAGEESFYASGDLTYKLTDNWRLIAGGVVGASNSFQQRIGQLCGSCANLALNGTTNANGNLTTPSVVGSTIIALNTPLTAANALDVFHTGAANLTSAAVRARLIDSTLTQTARQTLRDGTIKLDGDLFNLPAGPVKVAVGGEIIYYTMGENLTQPQGTGPATTGSTTTNLSFDRNVKSAYAEFLVPVIGPDQNVPLVRKLDVNISGRYDDYSDFGSTENPKIGVDWELIEGFKLRANYAESFVAPALSSRGDANGTTAETNFANFAGPLNVPVAAYPNIVGLPGCVAGAVTCQVGTATVTGLQLNGGNNQLKAETGESYAIGADWQPAFLPGLRASVTYWSNQLTGAVTAPTAALAVNAQGLNSLLTIFPGGATPAQIAAITAGRPQTAPLPQTVYFVYSFQQQNALNLLVQGVDGSIQYTFDTDLGSFDVNAIASYKTKFQQQVGTGGPKFDVLGTTGINTTFPSIQLDSRVGASWKSKFGLSADLFWNHTSSYKNWGNTPLNPVTRNAQGVPTGGGDKVKAGNTIDVHVAYDFAGKGLTQGLQVYLDVTNLFDKDPPFYNTAAPTGGTASGYDAFSGNPIGRLVSVGARQRF
jgi:iron complex outermembrane receptor protein